MAANPASCLPLKITHDLGEITLSTTERAIGTVVEFLCARADDALHGPSALLCKTSGRWNGTVPRCINNDELANLTTTESDVITSTFDPSSSTTPGVEHEGSQIDTVVILLWAVGGAMLLTLVVLLVCILRSHKKARRDRSNRHPGRGSPRHGGTNPSFSPYDEIWTWIPVVRDSQDHCPAPINPTTRENSSESSSIAERNLLETLRLPSYNEAVRNNQNRQNNTSSQAIPRPSVSVEARDNGRESGTRPQPSVTNINENPYDTIPADVSSRRYNQTASNVTRISVTAASGTVVSRMPNHPSVYQASPSHSSRSHDVISGLQSPGALRYSGHAERQATDFRHNPSTQPPWVQDATDTLQVRTIYRPQIDYPPLQSGENGDTSEFLHSEGSAFAHYRERTQRVNDVTRSMGHEEIAGSGDPAVSLTRLPRYQPYGVVPSAPSYSLDSSYF